MLLGVRVEPMQVFVLVEDASILVVCVRCSWLPWLLSILLNRILFVPASIIVMMKVVTMSGTVVGYFKPLVSVAVSMLHADIGSSSGMG